MLFVCILKKDTFDEQVISCEAPSGTLINVYKYRTITSKRCHLASILNIIMSAVDVV